MNHFKKTSSVALTTLVLLFLIAVPIFADEFPAKAYSDMIREHEEVLHSLHGSSKAKYETTHSAFLSYIEAERENLKIFDGEMLFMGEKLHIYRDNLRFALQNRLQELTALKHANKNWLLQPTKKNLMHSFVATNRRVPYDRGELLRSSFRKVDKEWHNFMESEQLFYGSFFNDVAWSSRRAFLVAHHVRLKNLYSEYKGVIAIKVEKEE